jgi:Cu-Zn family superoxide dismutase
MFFFTPDYTRQNMRLQRVTGFILANFIVAALADVTLNAWSHLRTAPASVRSLQTYFAQHTPLTAALYAGLTVIVVLILAMIGSYFLFGFAVPMLHPVMLVKFLGLALILGYAADVIIAQMELFGPSLRSYYRTVGAGLWGGLALVISVIVSIVVLRFLVWGPCVQQAVAVFKRVSGKGVDGDVTFETDTTNGNVKIHVDLSDGLTAGQKHGFHIHEAGDLRGEGCKKACAHYNPTNTSHGGLDGGHAGDLGNLRGNTSGGCKTTLTTNKFSVAEIVGRTLIIHADADDLGLGDQPDSKTTGHSGVRMACAVIGRIGAC